MAGFFRRRRARCWAEHGDGISNTRARPAISDAAGARENSGSNRHGSDHRGPPDQTRLDLGELRLSF